MMGKKVIEVEQEEAVQQTGTTRKEAWEWIKALLIAAALVFIIRTFVFAPFIVEGPSMEPNFYTGERLIVNKLIYTIRKPHRGEVIVFHATPEKDFIKRVIALPGDTIKVANNKVYLNGQELKEPYIESTVADWAKNGRIYNTPDYQEFKVPDGDVFVMGDDRPNSTDSRMIGPVPYSKIVGRADFIFWPFDKIEFIKHTY